MDNRPSETDSLVEAALKCLLQPDPWLKVGLGGHWHCLQARSLPGMRTHARAHMCTHARMHARHARTHARNTHTHNTHTYTHT
eukprot:1139767-Pelagomonas_calceolata.AAC.6